MTSHEGTYVYSIVINTRWSDMDALGHVNNSVFFTYFEQARIDWWEAQDLPNLFLEDSGPVVVHASCTYRKPIICPEKLLIKVFIGGRGNTSYDSFYEIYSEKDPAVLYAEGSTKIVWVNRKTGRPAPLPDYLVRLFPN